MRRGDPRWLLRRAMRASAVALAAMSACSSYDEQPRTSDAGPADASPSGDCCATSDASPGRIDSASDEPDAAPRPTPVSKVVAAPYGACAILGDGRVKCWGINGAGQLGVGDTVPRGGGDAGEEMGDALPSVPLQGRAIDIALGRVANADSIYAFACALVEGGNVECWGDNTYGQLGRGNNISIGGTKESALAISPVNLAEPATAIGVGGYSACALLASGGVKCWGRSTVGELGYGDTSIRGSQPGSLGAALPYVPLGQKAIALSVGYLHACALLESHDVKCWGNNARGQLGIDSRLNVGDKGGLDASIPMSAIGAPVAAIHAGAEATCAVLTTGALKCWGYNGYGILGLGDGENRGTGDDAGPLLRDLAPVDLGDGGLVTGMSLGHTMTCAVREGGTAKCWGSNLSGALGLGDTLIRGDQPNEMGNNLPAIPFRNVTSIAVGMAFTCAVTEGRVKCWGNGDYGQLGLGDRQTRGDKPGYEFVLPFVDLGH